MVRFIADFRKINKMIMRKPYPSTNKKYTIIRFGNFTSATVIDKIINYFHIRISENTKIYSGRVEIHLEVLEEVF